MASSTTDGVIPRGSTYFVTNSLYSLVPGCKPFSAAFCCALVVNTALTSGVFGAILSSACSEYRLPPISPPPLGISHPLSNFPVPSLPPELPSLLNKVRVSFPRLEADLTATVPPYAATAAVAGARTTPPPEPTRTTVPPVPAINSAEPWSDCRCRRIQTKRFLSG